MPYLEWAVAKFILIPNLLKHANKTKALVNFSEVSEDIIQLCADLSPEELGKRRLIKRLRGLEDSSRFWSVAMTLEHLIIVDTTMLKVITDLSTGSTDLKPVGTAEVKPNGTSRLDQIVQEFNAVQTDFIERSKIVNVDAFPQAKLSHPWFGPLNALEWLTFAGLHSDIHRRQVKAIKMLL